MKTEFLNRFQFAAGLVVVVAGLLVTAGWLLDIELLRALIPGFAPMKLNPAICFVLSGVLVLMYHKGLARKHIAITYLISAVIFATGFITLLQYIFEMNTGIDTLLVADRLAFAEPYPGRMAPSTSFCFCFLGLAFALSGSAKPVILRATQYVLHSITIVALLAIVGYWYGVPSFYTLSFLTSMALPTSILLFLVSVGASCIHPHMGIVGLLSGSRTGNIVARRTFPWMTGTLLILGYLRVESHRYHMVSVELGISLFVISFLFIGLLIIRNTAKVLNRMDRERSKAEELLRSAETNYHEIFDKASDAIYVHEMETGKVVEVNHRATEITGFAKEELLNSHPAKFITDDPRFSLEHAMGYIQKAAMGAPQIFEWLGKRKDGSSHWYEVNLKKATIAGKERILAFFHEIGDRKKAEESLVASQQRFRSIIEQFPYPVISYAPSGIYIAANKAWETMWDDSRENITGYNILQDAQLLNSPLGAVIRRAFAGELSVSTPYLYDPELIGQKGRKRWMVMTIYPLKSESGAIQEIVLILQDVTDSKEAEDKLAQSEKRLRYTLDNMLEGAQIIGFDWRYLYLNDTLEKQGKFPREELLGRTMMEKYPGYEQTVVYGYIKRCMEERAPFHILNEFKFPDGSVGWFELSIQPVPEGVFILSVDVTERKNAEAEIHALNESLERKVTERTMQLTEANKALEAFSYSISHDLRSPLRVIYGYADMLEEDYNAVFDSEGKRLLNIIQENAKKMGTLIDDLLAFAKLGRADVRRTGVDMKELAQGVWDELYKGSAKNVTITIGELHPAQADRNLMGQVFTNLVSNALKYSANAANPQVEIQSRADNGEIIYSVKDNGAGFDMQYVDKLFGVFHRLHKANEFEGTGVGLAIVQGIINKHGGRVWAEGAVGAGATFYFTLPAG